MSERAVSILVVDDEETSRFAVRRFLERRGLAVEEAADCASAMARARERPPDAAILDYRLPDGTAIDLIADFHALDPEISCLVLTGHGSIELAVEAMRVGAEQFLTKPVDLETLFLLVERAVQRGQGLRRSRAVEATSGVAQNDPFLGQSPAIRRLAGQAQKVVRSGRPLLILGETGAGKGVLAHWLHLHGPRAKEPMVDLNCAGFTRELLESELFGHAKGAFTGATSAKAGLIEIAHRGVLFLDEIGDLPLEEQPKLLKVLEEGKLRRVGEVSDRSVDLQLIAATHRDLEQEVAAGRFRQDLFFRISTIPLVVPSLRERRQDIALLADVFLRRFARELGRSGLRLTETAVRALGDYSWPGNLRQLRNVLERAALLADADSIDSEHLGLPAAEGALSNRDGDGVADDSIDAVLQRHIRKVLLEEDGSVERAARRLGVSRSGLYKRMRRLEIELPSA